MQHGFLYYSLFEPESGVGIKQLSYSFNRSFNPIAFERAWQSAIDRHSSLRTLITYKYQEKPLQIVLRSVKVPIIEQDWRALSKDEQERKLGDYLRADRQKGFDLSQAPLLRLALMRLS